MASLLCFRSLKATLVAAASTSALFAAANWDLASFMILHSVFIDMSLVKRIFVYAAGAFAMPLMPLLYSVTNAMKVWAVKSSLQISKNMQHSQDIHIDHGSVAIITLCPTFIIFPAAASSDRGLGEHFGGYRKVSVPKGLEDVWPVELRASPRGRVMNDTVDAAHKDNDAYPALQDSTHELICLELPDTSRNTGVEALQERAALLCSSLAPNYEELRFLRSRKKFQSVVTALQASGYLLTVVQRLAQHLSISPIEAITSFLCIVLGLQLLIELYACSHYQRPLLIHLSAHQFRCFRDASREKIVLQEQYFLILSSPVWLLILSLAMYYYIHYVHACHNCSLSALLFFVAQAIFVVFFSLKILLGGLSNRFAVLLLGSGILYVCSLILAVISTAKKWKAFHETSHQNWFAWLLPHVSG